jgi:hypothetical protein
MSAQHTKDMPDVNVWWGLKGTEATGTFNSQKRKTISNVYLNILENHAFPQLEEHANNLPAG